MWYVERQRGEILVKRYSDPSCLTDTRPQAVICLSSFWHRMRDETNCSSAPFTKWQAEHFLNLTFFSSLFIMCNIFLRSISSLAVLFKILNLVCASFSCTRISWKRLLFIRWFGSFYWTGWRFCVLSVFKGGWVNILDVSTQMQLAEWFVLQNGAMTFLHMVN